MKKLLIISPYFPPINAADMHRVRQSVAFYNQLGWEPTVVMVQPHYAEFPAEPLLLKTIPDNIKIIQLKAFSARFTRKIGLGAIALRAFPFYFFAVNALLKKTKYDLIFFSTTQFPVITLGRYWRWRFNILYIVDIQDPWHKADNNFKFTSGFKSIFAYYLNKYTEPFALKKTSGIVSVSKGYIDILKKRYSNINDNNSLVLPFGAFEKDFDVANTEVVENRFLDNQYINFVYVGRGGSDMHLSISIIFEAFLIGLKSNPTLFSNIRFHFIGTSYAPSGKGVKTIEPIAHKYGVEQYVFEYTDRLPYFQSLKTLQQSDVLFMPGSIDPNYTASKLYPYILAKRPLICIFNSQSSVVSIMKETNAGEIVTFSENERPQNLANDLFTKMNRLLSTLPFIPPTDWDKFRPYTASEMTKKQVDFFNKIISSDNSF